MRRGGLADTIFIVQGSPSPQASIDGFPVVWLAIGGGLAVAALILYFLHIRRL